MGLTKEQQAILLHDAAILSGMNGHVQTSGDTAAERAMRMFGGRKDAPRKMSYLYCSSVDACFYYNNDRACVTFTAQWFVGAKDLEGAKLVNAVSYIRNMLDNMQSLADSVLTAKKEE